MRYVIMLCGKMRSGKNQVGEFIEAEFKNVGKTVKQDLFAYDLKKMCSEDFSMFADVVNKVASNIHASVNSLFSSNDMLNMELVGHVNASISQLMIRPENWWEVKTPLTRAILQIIGTDVMRKRVDDLIWINGLRKRVEESNDDVTIVTDVRFPNEILSFGIQHLDDTKIRMIAVNIVRDTDIVDEHESEKALDGWKEYDYIIDNNFSIDMLRENAKKMVLDILADNTKEYVV